MIYYTAFNWLNRAYVDSDFLSLVISDFFEWVCLWRKEVKLFA